MNRFASRLLPSSICTLSVLAVCALSGCGDDESQGPADIDAPSEVSDLAVTVEEDTIIVLSWTAPGDAGPSGKAAAYDVRHSGSIITEMNWDGATGAEGEPAPQDPGLEERFAVASLKPEESYYFALKAADGEGNLSELSNVVLLDVDPPVPIADLQVSGTTSRTATLAWTAPFDNGEPGQAAAYDVRYSLEAITESTWESASRVTGAPVPGAAGGLESFVVPNLAPSTDYTMAVRSMDHSGNISALSNVVEVATADAPQGWWDGFEGQALNDEVASLMSIDGNLVVGGLFTKAGGVAAYRIVSWNGVGWSGFGQGFRGAGTPSVGALAEYGGDLIAGGYFSNSGGSALSNIAGWDGVSWLPLHSGTDGMVFDLAVFDGDLYVGGLLFGAGGKDSRAIAR